MISVPTVRKRGHNDKPSVIMGARILIADDDFDCRQLLLMALRNAGNQVVVARDGGELLDKIANVDEFDLIITDIDMPWMQGVQVLASIREAELRTPVLVITGLTRPDLPELIARIGNARLLHKPFDVHQLRAAVAELMAPVALT